MSEPRTPRPVAGKAPQTAEQLAAQVIATVPVEPSATEFSADTPKAKPSDAYAPVPGAPYSLVSLGSLAGLLLVLILLRRKP